MLLQPDEWRLCLFLLLPRLSFSPPTSLGRISVCGRGGEEGETGCHDDANIMNCASLHACDFNEISLMEEKTALEWSDTTAMNLCWSACRDVILLSLSAAMND